MYQTFYAEDNIYPEASVEAINSKTIGLDEQIKEDEEKRKKDSLNNILDCKIEYKKLRKLNQPVSIRHRIKAHHIQEFKSIVEQI